MITEESSATDIQQAAVDDLIRAARTLQPTREGGIWIDVVWELQARARDGSTGALAAIAHLRRVHNGSPVHNALLRLLL